VGRFLPLPSPLPGPEQSGVRARTAGFHFDLMIALYFVVAFVAGALVTTQTGSNARLKEALEHPLPAVILSSAVGVLLLLAAAVVARAPVPSVQKVAGAPWSAWLGGVLGASYAIIVVLLARRLGAATLTALVVTGQLVCSVILDHFGLIGFDVHPATTGRIAGCLLLFAGLALIWRF
jgi:transporter family-2 protein